MVPVIWILIVISFSTLGYVAEGDAVPTMDEIIVSSATSSYALDMNQDNNTVLVEGDMEYSKEDWLQVQAEMNSRKGLASARRRWRMQGKVGVPYVMAGFSSRDRREIKSAIDEWNAFTCINWYPRKNRERNYVYIKDGRGCSSAVGMVGGSQNVKLAPGCRYKRTILHELGHAMGYTHEQCRTDRDRYVTIKLDNVKYGHSHNFDKYPEGSLDYQGVPYDYTSIMHYGKSFFSKNGRATIVPKDSSMLEKIGRAAELSFADVKAMNLMYECGDHCGNTACPGDGYMDKNCVCQCKNFEGESFDKGYVPIVKCGGGECKDKYRWCGMLGDEELDEECNDPETDFSQGCCETCKGH